MTTESLYFQAWDCHADKCPPNLKDDDLVVVKLRGGYIVKNYAGCIRWGRALKKMGQKTSVAVDTTGDVIAYAKVKARVR